MPGPKYRHYPPQTLERDKNGVPVLAKEIPANILPRELFEDLSENQIRFLVSFWKLEKQHMAMAAIGLAINNVGHWKAKNPAFKEAYETLRTIITEKWEGRLEDSWNEGYEEHEDVYKKDPETGEVERVRVKTRIKRDTSTLRLINQGLQPGKFGSGGPAGGTTINIIVERPDAKKPLQAAEVRELAPVEIVESDQEEENG